MKIKSDKIIIEKHFYISTGEVLTIGRNLLEIIDLSIPSNIKEKLRNNMRREYLKDSKMVPYTKTTTITKPVRTTGDKVGVWEARYWDLEEKYNKLYVMFERVIEENTKLTDRVIVLEERIDYLESRLSKYEPVDKMKTE
ncbi:hypothetical protein [Spiroplasma endosymbiont of Othius punctulatus]|uniref:hypothetical protein n=1 Tax=Spiroplasma endosymbiont of Othius punctulatus TaxID=3066289 RepID=UPI0030D3FF73